MSDYLAVARAFMARDERNEGNEQSPPPAGVSSSSSSLSSRRSDAAAGTWDRTPNQKDQGPRNQPGDPIGATAANVAAASAAERDGWRREVVAALRWTEAGRGVDHNLGHDLAALRRLVPPGACLECGGPAPRDGRHWCAACERAARRDGGGRGA